jgi:NitT/TauT family transport system substrate-binding protein
MRKALAALALVAVIGTGCASSAARAAGSDTVLRLGVFPNLTHGPALIGISKGIIQKDLGSMTKLKIFTFTSGSEASNAMLSGSIDATYIGPGPTTSLFAKSGKIAVVSGVTQGGASLVVRTGAGISSPADFAGKKVADPGVGNTQDVALKTWLHSNGLKTTDEGGNVTIVPLTKNSDSIQYFSGKQVDAAWLPEPYPSLLIAQGLGSKFLDERTLWPGGHFATTGLVVATGYLTAHPDVVKNLVKGNVDSIRYIRANPTQAQQIANTEIVTLGGKSLDSAPLAQAWAGMTFSWDPAAASLQQDAKNAASFGLIDSVPSNLLSVYKLADLNAILIGLGLPSVQVPA